MLAYFASHAIRLTGADAPAVRASRKLRSDELLVVTLGSTILRKHLDDVPLWRGDHVPIRQLVEDFARYRYLPRLNGPEMLVQSIRDGVALFTWQADTFAYAESYDEDAKRYRGLRAGQVVNVSAEDAGLLVKPDVARRQLEVEAQPVPGGTQKRPTGGETSTPTGGTIGPTGGQPAHVLPRRFHGTVRLDPARAGRDASRIADEVIAHLAGQIGAELIVTLEMEAKLPSGASDQLVRAVTENGRTLKFENYGFEGE